MSIVPSEASVKEDLPDINANIQPVESSKKKEDKRHLPENKQDNEDGNLSQRAEMEVTKWNEPQKLRTGSSGAENITSDNLCINRHGSVKISTHLDLDTSTHLTNLVHDKYQDNMKKTESGVTEELKKNICKVKELGDSSEIFDNVANNNAQKPVEDINIENEHEGIPQRQSNVDDIELVDVTNATLFSERICDKAENGNESCELLSKSDEKETQDEEKNSILEQKLRENMNDNLARDCILEPLSFPEKASLLNQITSGEEKFHLVFETDCSPEDTPCVLCANVYKDIDEKSQYDEYLCHLVVEHKLVIADVKLIANLREYAIYWKKRFTEKPIEEFCASINTNMSPKDVGESEKYYLLCDALPEDRKVREALQLKRLKDLIEVQTKERENEEFERMCLFCTKFVIGNRNELFNHMNEDHNFNVGHPHNLIYVEDFLDEIEKKLSSLECLFCDKVFKDRASLREHMRKKSHRRLNPKNKLYDKYYIINYLELGKNWEVLQSEPDQLEGNDDWTGWEDEGQTAVCFFCTSSFNTQDRVFEHMKRVHGFDFPEMRMTMNLSFYQQVKMVNYIRRTVHQLRQREKQEKIDNVENDSDSSLTLIDAITKSVKDCILSSTKWNQPQYYFPTYENDTLLCQLEDKEGLYEPEDNFIIGEDGIDCKAIINESVLTDLVVRGYFD
uniref:zinc finger protein 277-like n=1 Tax=Styela clava TaxID=7725 RepID=UPI00193A6082|nr:zinc finger protein 277-like [Styela clava]